MILHFTKSTEKLSIQKKERILVQPQKGIAVFDPKIWRNFSHHLESRLCPIFKAIQ